MKTNPVVWGNDAAGIPMESCMRVSPALEPINMSTLSTGRNGGLGSCYEYRPSGLTRLPCSPYATARSENPLYYIFDVQSFIIPDEGQLIYRYTPYVTPVPSGGIDLDVSRPVCPTIGTQILTLTQYLEPGDSTIRWPGTISFFAPLGVFLVFDGLVVRTEIGGSEITLSGTSSQVQNISPVPVRITWKVKLS